jgi:hypothetical protein
MRTALPYWFGSSDRLFVSTFYQVRLLLPIAPSPIPALHLPLHNSTMSSKNSSTSASVGANQALITLLARIEDLIQQVIQAPSEEEKMGLSRRIAREVVSFLDFEGCIILLLMFIESWHSCARHGCHLCAPSASVHRSRALQCAEMHVGTGCSAGLEHGGEKR